MPLPTDKLSVQIKGSHPLAAGCCGDEPNDRPWRYVHYSISKIVVLVPPLIVYTFYMYCCNSCLCFVYFSVIVLLLQFRGTSTEIWCGQMRRLLNLLMRIVILQFCATAVYPFIRIGISRTILCALVYINKRVE